MFRSLVVPKRLRFILWGIALATAIGASFSVIAGVLSLFEGLPFLGSDNVYLSLVCVVIAWLLTAMFLLARETIFVPVNQPGPFLSNACQVLEEMGYVIAAETQASLVTTPYFHLLFLGRGIKIQWADKQASMGGPKLWVDMLRRRLRVQNFLAGNELALSDPCMRPPEVLLKRAQIQMRVSPDKLPEVQRQVLHLLTAEADVVCEINLLINSDNGIRESTLEQRIRPWLQQQGIVAEIHKDLVKMAESPSGVILAAKEHSSIMRRKALKVGERSA